VLIAWAHRRPSSLKKWRIVENAMHQRDD
jgi:hypothetical protein